MSIPPEKLKQAHEDANKLKETVRRRCSESGREIDCPLGKSKRTPCVVRDGNLAVGFKFQVRAICVGCDWSLNRLIKDEVEKRNTNA